MEINRYKAQRAAWMVVGMMDRNFPVRWRVRVRTPPKTDTEYLWATIRMLLDSVEINCTGPKDTFRTWDESKPQPIMDYWENKELENEEIKS